MSSKVSILGTMADKEAVKEDEAKAAKEKLCVFIVRCPIGDCSKKGGILAKKLTEEDARAAVSWHLQRSPYHEFEKTEADDFATLVALETSEEDP